MGYGNFCIMWEIILKVNISCFLDMKLLCKQYIIMQLPPRENRDDLYATLNWFSED